MVLFVGETPQRADGRVPMFGSPVEVAVGIAAATAKVMALFHSPQDEARSSHQIFQPRGRMPESAKSYAKGFRGAI
jgi:hypothetical protein